MRNTSYLILGMLLALVLPGCSPDESEVPPVAPPVKEVQVEVLKVAPRNLVEDFTLPGSLEAWQDLLLAAEIAGPVEEVLVEEGAAIHQGDELVRIDTLTLQAGQESARSEYELRKKTEDRLARLHAEQLVSTQEYDNAVSALRIAAANLRTADIMLEKAQLVSPLDGLLERRFVEPGEYVGAGDPLVRVVRIDKLKINVDVPEKDISFMKPGDRVVIEGTTTQGWGYDSLEGRISHAGYVGAAQTRTYPVRIEIDNPRGALRPGMIVRTRFVRRNLDQVLTVPLYAVVERDGGKYLFLRDGDLARQQQVVLGVTLNGKVVIREGLAPGDEVVVKGQQLLIDGVRIALGGGS